MKKCKCENAIRIINNALYFNDNSDYETALWEALTELTGNEYIDNDCLIYMEEPENEHR